MENGCYATRSCELSNTGPNRNAANRELPLKENRDPSHFHQQWSDSSTTEGEGAAAKTTSKQFDFPNLLDLHSAALYLRSQPLKQGNVYRLTVYPATNAYLATIKVIGRDKISVRAGTYNAIKLDLQLKRIGKHLELEPHKKFRRATIWVSEDAERLVLRIEAQIFVGTVFAELQSVHFDNSNQR